MPGVEDPFDDNAGSSVQGVASRPVDQADARGRRSVAFAEHDAAQVVLADRGQAAAELLRALPDAAKQTVLTRIGLDRCRYAATGSAPIDPEIVELMTTIALWNALARFHRAMGFDLDMDPPPPEIDELL